MIIDFNDLYKSVTELPEDMRNILVIKLLADEKVDYSTVSTGYVEYIQRLKNEQTNEYQELQQHVTKIYCDYKKNRDKNIFDAIVFLWKKRRINLSKDEIVKLSKKFNYDIK